MALRCSDFRERKTIEDYEAAGLEKETFVDPEIRLIDRAYLSWRIGLLSECDRSKFGL